MFLPASGWYAAFVVTLAVLLAACATAASPTPTPASATLTATPSPSPTPTPPSVPPATVAWTQMATIDVGSNGGISGARALAGGYVAWGTYATSYEGRDRALATWFSPDGRTWERTIHSEVISPCPGGGEEPYLDPVYADASASDGRTLVIMATLLLLDADACDRAWVISLSTTDGRTWAQSQPFTPPHWAPSWFVWAEDAWAIPGGWEATVNAEEALTIWRSTDLDTWYWVASRPEIVDWVGGVAPDGTRLAVSEENETQRATLLASPDSITWRVVRPLPTEFDAVGIAPPSEAGRPWLVATEMHNGKTEEARVLVSTDLLTWQSSTFPRPGIGALTATRFGWIAIGYWPLRATGCGDECRPEDPTLFTSADGVTWVEHDLPSEASIFVGDDPGLLAIGWGAPSTESEFGVWRVSRMTSGEK